MSEFDRVIIGNGPYDQKSLIEGLSRDFKSSSTILQNDLGPIRLELEDGHIKIIPITGEINVTVIEP